MAIGATLGGSTASGGSCAADASASVPPWGWGTLAVACTPTSLSGLGCGTGGQCVPAPPAPFASHVCVLGQDGGACPAGDYSVAHVYYPSASDSRGCSPCSCASPTGVDCNTHAQVEIWPSQGCDAGAAQPVNGLPSSCVAPAFKAQGATFASTPTAGSCAPLGGQPTGTVVGQNPVTICCTP